MAKYKVPVSIQTVATHVIGEIECDSAEEFKIKAHDLWAEKGWNYPTANIHNDFDLHDWDITEIGDDDLQDYKST
ncbi:hypothetical protein [Sedimenticola selenatireducens]|uniref:Uncharacterized protein n=1 Tax=Sedimenticola selenatireducens TaxID=191960 RepID=A0A558E105_9GAMM|nr:hypothetical protein [Sedimenticola selenatireducens]TVO75105.1 hypothetical protein FHP88_08820 [Sedimenticola selenatireducens]TVT67041.1 MAG: hypothetical protein FHK78_01540 [Sedimenticola selenatireducens]